MMEKDNEVIGLKKIIVGYLYHWKLFLSIFIVSIILGCLYYIFVPTTYEMVARIQLQEDKSLGSGGLALGEASGLMKSFGLGNMTGGALSVDDEIVKLLSNGLLSEVVEDLGLNINYIKPYNFKVYMYDEMPFILQPDSLTNKTLNSYVTFDIHVNSSGKIDIRIVNNDNSWKKTYASLPVKIDLPIGQFELRSNDKEKLQLPCSAKIEFIPVKWKADMLVEELKVEEYSKTSKIIELFYQDYEVNRGVDLLNAMISIYNRKESSFKKLEGKKSIDFLNERIDSVSRALTSIEQDIESYKVQNEVMQLEYDVQFYAEQMKELQVKMIELETNGHIIDLMYSFIKDPSNKYHLVPSLLAGSEASDVSSPLSLYNAALLEREKLLQTTKGDNPLIERTNSQIDRLRETVFKSIENAKKSYNLTLADLKNKENVLLTKMRSVPYLEKEYVDLKRKQEIYQAVYLILLQKREEISLSVGEDSVRGRIIDNAYVKEIPVGPRKLFIALAILLFSIIVPVFYLFIKEQILLIYNEYKRKVES